MAFSKRKQIGEEMALPPSHSAAGKDPPGQLWRCSLDIVGTEGAILWLRNYEAQLCLFLPLLWSFRSSDVNAAGHARQRVFSILNRVGLLLKMRGTQQLRGYDNFGKFHLN